MQGIYRYARVTAQPLPLAGTHVDAEWLQKELEQTLTGDVYDQWVTSYGMRDRVACPADFREELKEQGVGTTPAWRPTTHTR